MRRLVEEDARIHLVEFVARAADRQPAQRHVGRLDADDAALPGAGENRAFLTLEDHGSGDHHGPGMLAGFEADHVARRRRVHDRLQGRPRLVGCEGDRGGSLRRDRIHVDAHFVAVADHLRRGFEIHAVRLGLLPRLLEEGIVPVQI